MTKRRSRSARGVRQQPDTLADGDSGRAPGHVEALFAECDAAHEASRSNTLFGAIVKTIVDERSIRSHPWIDQNSGFMVRPLWHDGNITLVRCSEGATIPSHGHEREERVVVLDGHLRIGNEHYRTGACIISPPGSFHEAAEALTPCLFVIQFGPEKNLR